MIGQIFSCWTLFDLRPIFGIKCSKISFVKVVLLNWFLRYKLVWWTPLLCFTNHCCKIATQVFTYDNPFDETGENLFCIYPTTFGTIKVKVASLLVLLSNKATCRWLGKTHVWLGFVILHVQLTPVGAALAALPQQCVACNATLAPNVWSF